MNARYKPRPWFQLHLSTCVALMIAIGGILAANFAPAIPLALDKKPVFIECGFPGKCYFRTDWTVTERYKRAGVTVQFDEGVLFFNVLCAVLLLAAHAVALEWRIRARAYRKEMEKYLINWDALSR